jgi:hypothetical protein
VGPGYSTQSGSAARARWPGTVAVAVLLAVASVLMLAAQGAAAGAPAAAGGALELRLTPAGDPARELAGLEARAVRLARRYRGEVVQLTDAEQAAKAAVARVVRLRRQLGRAHRDVARLAAAGYMAGVQDPAVAILGNGNPQRVLEDAATIDYLARQRSARQRSLERFMAAEQRAERDAQHTLAGLRRLVASLVSQRHKVAALIARFHPQSPVAGGTITPRMRQVKDAIDRRFGPFASIGCYRAGSDGEHSLGRACDFMLSTGGVLPAPAGVQRGYQIAAWAQANAPRLGILYVIYRQRIWDIRTASSGWLPMADRGGSTANHYDHVHISVF